MSDKITSMKTIAISIDEDTLAALDRLRDESSGRSNRSRVIRRAIRDLAEREERSRSEKNDDQIVRANRARLDREARALVAAQARP